MGRMDPMGSSQILNLSSLKLTESWQMFSSKIKQEIYMEILFELFPVLHESSS